VANPECNNARNYTQYIVSLSLAKELWRLRVNFFVLLVLLFTSSGYVSPLASLHQFVTNPTLEEQNGTQMVATGI